MGWAVSGPAGGTAVRVPWGDRSLMGRSWCVCAHLSKGGQHQELVLHAAANKVVGGDERALYLVGVIRGLRGGPSFLVVS